MGNLLVCKSWVQNGCPPPTSASIPVLRLAGVTPGGCCETCCKGWGSWGGSGWGGRTGVGLRCHSSAPIPKSSCGPQAAWAEMGRGDPRAEAGTPSLLLMEEQGSSWPWDAPSSARPEEKRMPCPAASPPRARRGLLGCSINSTGCVLESEPSSFPAASDSISFGCPLPWPLVGTERDGCPGTPARLQPGMWGACGGLEGSWAWKGSERFQAVSWKAILA